MELIAAAVAFYAVFLPVFLALEVATPHPEAVRRPLRESPEQAAARWLAAHPLKRAPTPVAAHDDWIDAAA